MWNVSGLRRKRMTLLCAVMLLALLPGCATERIDVETTRHAVCPRPMTAEELNAVADAIEALPAGPALDLLAQQLDRLDEGAYICDRN